MNEKARRTPSRVLASLAFVALSGFAVSCGEEPQSTGEDKTEEKKAHQEEAQAPAPKPDEKEKKENTEKAEEPKPEKTEAEKT